MLDQLYTYIKYFAISLSLYLCMHVLINFLTLNYKIIVIIIFILIKEKRYTGILKIHSVNRAKLPLLNSMLGQSYFTGTNYHTCNG